MDRSPSQYMDDDPSSRLANRVGLLIDGKYRVLKLIGHGSTGAVYACRHEGLDKLVALKVLHREMEHNAGFVERFKLEAQAASRLEHPNSVRVLDFGQDAGGSLYIAMEYVDGRDLLQIIDDEGPFDTERTVDVMSQILDVLGVAHGVGIVHRDLKPENILVRPVQVDGVTRELVTVCDFGIAQLAQPPRRSGGGRLESSQEEEMVAGTPAYMSPEQARAQATDARSDLYSAGVVLYQLLTQHLPFVADDALTLAKKHCSEAPPRPSLYGPVNPILEEVCIRALAKSREDRYQSAREMRLALARALSPELGDTMIDPSMLVSQRWSVPHWNVHRSYIPPSGPSVPPLGVSQGTHTPLVAQLDRSGERRASMWPVAVGMTVVLLSGASALYARFGTRTTSTSAALASDHLVQPRLPVPAAQPSAVAESVPPDATSLPESMMSRLESLHDGDAPRPGMRAAPGGEVDVRGVSAPDLDDDGARGQKRAPVRASSKREDGKRAAPEAAATVRVEAQHAQADSQPAATPAVEAAVLAPTTPEPAALAPTAAPAPSKAAAVAPAAIAAPIPSKPSVSAASVDESSRPRSDDERAPLPPPAAADETPRPLKTLAPQPVAANRAHVTISGVESRAAVSRASVRSALNMGAITDCYRAALLDGTAPNAPVNAQITLTASASGSVSAATMDAPAFGAGFKHCVEAVARRGRVREADTGDAQAKITLAFAPR